jgi:NAD(P)-dependent dehydrogenase (short-subunit alcohol dehydrogenase family)
MASKDQIARDYLAVTKAKHLNPGVRRNLGGSDAVVVGSDCDGNIGAVIANRLLGTMANVYEHDKFSWHPDFMGSYSGLNTLILANGTTHLDWIEDQPAEKIEEVINDCLTTSIKATQAFVKYTIGKPEAKYIVFVGSMAYRSVLNGSAPYCAAKAGLAHFARCVAWELAPKGYNVFIVHPSNTEGTPMTEATIAGLQRYRGLSREDAEGYWGASLPRAAWLQPESIADVVEFLVSGNADYMSGGNIDLTGGQR